MRPLLGLLISAFLAIGPAAAQNALPPGLSFGGPFELTNAEGETVRDTDFRGRFMLIYFGYTFCPDICPTDLSEMGVAIDDLPDELAQQVQPIFITVDPGRDTPQIAQEYAQNFHSRLIGLSGGLEQVGKVVKDFRVHRAKVFVEGVAEDEYLVSHSPNTYLMGPDGKFLTLFPHDTPASRMTKLLKKYVGSDGEGAGETANTPTATVN